MTRDELVKALTALQDSGDPEIAHSQADTLLLQYIDDQEVTDAFGAIMRWYA